jgi:hypothetical protein
VTFTGQYQLTFEEYREGTAAMTKRQKVALRRGRGLFGWVLFLGLVVMLLILLQNNRGATGTAPPPPPPDPWPQLRSMLPWGIIFVIVWIIAFWAQRVLPRKTWEATPDYHRPTTVVIDDDGVRFTNHVSDVHFRWDAFTAFNESKALFLLMIRPHVGHPVPKRIFSEEQLPEVREFLRSRISAPASAFPVITRSQSNS